LNFKLTVLIVFLFKGSYSGRWWHQHSSGPLTWQTEDWTGITCKSQCP